MPLHPQPGFLGPAPAFSLTPSTASPGLLSPHLLLNPGSVQSPAKGQGPPEHHSSFPYMQSPAASLLSAPDKPSATACPHCHHYPWSPWAAQIPVAQGVV